MNADGYRYMRTLLAGFGPFGNTINNPSARIVEHFARSGAPGHELTARVLPVSFSRASDEIRALLSTARFDAAVLLGVAGKEACLRLERFARRRAAGRADVDGTMPGETELAPGAPDTCSASVPLEALWSKLTDAGLPTRLSDDAGDYVCNHTYHSALVTLTENRLLTRCLFVHVPADEVTYAEPVDSPTLPLQRQIEAVSLILEWLAELEPP
jgi:pyroglutamyl-peptidase